MTTEVVAERLARVLRDHPPLQAQVAIAEALADSGRVLTVLPTGAGKTLAAAAPFAAGLLPVRQLAFLTPLRTLADQQARVLREEIDGAAATAALGVQWDVREQTGAVPEDPLYEAPVVVGTFDQALSSALHISYSTSRRRRRINAGAILVAYIVADEIHLYPREAALTTLLWLLRDRPDLPFCLMTATLSVPLVQRLAGLVHARVVDALTPADRDTLRVANRRRTVRWSPEPFEASAILAAVRSGRRRVLVVVNTVDRAIQLGRDLGELAGRAVAVHVLHARFYPDDRARATERVLAALGKKERGDGRPTIVVATQVVEAGVDLSADVLFTELAPASSLVQRIGRCARWGGEGEIVVAPPPSVDGTCWPYASADERDVVTRTRDWLGAEATRPLLLEEATERAFVDEAHRAADERWLDGLEADLDARRELAGRVGEEGDYPMAGVLVRHVDKRTVLVHGHHADPMLQEPTRLVGFSLATGSLYGLVKRVLNEPAPSVDDDGAGWLSLDLPSEATWRLMRPVWEADASEGSERQVARVQAWVPIGSDQELRGEPLVLLHPSHVAYSARLGLELRPGVIERVHWAHPLPWRGPGTGGSWLGSARGETFQEHARRMLLVYEQTPCLGPRIRAIASIVEAWLGWPAGLLDTVIRAAICLHDAGKLAPGWSAAIAAYQAAIGVPALRFMAHSTPVPSGMKTPDWKPPPHALAGAAVSLAVGEALDTIAVSGPGVARRRAIVSRVLFWAIATHHAPSPASPLRVPREQEVGPAGRAEILRVLALNGVDSPALTLPPAGLPLDDYRVSTALQQPRTLREWFAYALVCRALRLADGWSQEPERVDALEAASEGIDA